MAVTRHLITSIEGSKEYQLLLDLLCKTNVIAVDVETTGLDYINDEIIGVGFAVFDHAFYVDMVDWFEDEIDEFWEDIGPYFVREDKTWIAHNAPFDLYFIRRELYNRYPDFEVVNLETSPLGEWWDTLSMATLVNESLVGVTVPLKQPDGKKIWSGALSLKVLSKYYLGRDQRIWDKNFSEWPVEKRGQYGMDDVINTYDLAFTLYKQLNKIPIKENHNKTLWDYYLEIVAPQTYVVESMERYGVKINRGKLESLLEETQEEIYQLDKELKEIVSPQRKFKYSLRGEWTRSKFIELAEKKQWPLPLTKAGNPSVRASVLEDLAQKYSEEFNWDEVREVIETPFNPDSPQQLGEYLVSVGVDLPRTTKTKQPSTNERALQKAKEDCPELEIWKPLERRKKLVKLVSTYIGPLLEYAWEDDSVHPEWHCAGTVTGRYSSSKSSKNGQLIHKRGPAMQTIPNPEHENTEHNPREWFVARPGYKLIIMDLSQAEVRMLAVRSQDPKLIEAIKTGEDIHTSNAATMFGNEWLAAYTDGREEDLKHMRSVAKTMTFGIMYGMGPSSLAQLLDITYPEANKYLSQYYHTFSGVERWKHKMQMQILRKGYSTSIGGRRRRPIVLQSPPRITVLESKDPQEYERQRFRELVFNCCWDRAIKRGHFDDVSPSPDALDARGVRQGINFAIQASVGDMINYAAAQLVLSGYRVLIQMHDELVLEVRDDEEIIEKAIERSKELLERELRGIKFVVDFSVGDNWGVGKE